MKNKDKLIKKISKSVIVLFGVLTVFNIIMLINKKSYALFQKTIETDKVIHIETASEFPSESGIGTEVVKDTLGKNGGVIGLDNNSNKVVTESDNIREYRYSGLNVNNYVYFNCTPNVVQSENSCEKWRIVGVFKEGEEEHLKIVRDNILTTDMFPETYTYGGTYNIKYSSGAYWNKKTSGTNDNDWVTAGLQYWLNGESETGYLGKLKTGVKDMIADTKYYLGSFKEGSKGDTPITAYNHEREGSKVWTGKIGLLYPSDYGFSAESSNWNTVLYKYNSASTSSWLQSANHSSYEWLLSPSASGSNNTTYWKWNGIVYDGSVDQNDFGVRPVLNLQSTVGITGGNGTQSTPYKLILN